MKCEQLVLPIITALGFQLLTVVTTEPDSTVRLWKELGITRNGLVLVNKAFTQLKGDI
jgi:hypothetical protein